METTAVGSIKCHMTIEKGIEWRNEMGNIHHDCVKVGTANETCPDVSRLQFSSVGTPKLNT